MKKGKARTFKRDSRSPVPSSPTVSYVMSSIKPANTKPEMIIRRSLFAIGVRGYRLHWRKVPGRPDIAFTTKKIAIFINGCFWHRCPKCNLPMPKSNSSYWAGKFEKNIIRDRKKAEELKKIGWDTLVVWECEIQDDLLKVIRKIMKALKNIK